MAKRRRRGEGSITQRKDGRWHGRIDLGRDLNGNRATKHVYAASHAALLRKLKILSAQVVGGGCVPTATPTLARYLQD